MTLLHTFLVSIPTSSPCLPLLSTCTYLFSQPTSFLCLPLHHTFLYSIPTSSQYLYPALTYLYSLSPLQADLYSITTSPPYLHLLRISSFACFLSHLHYDYPLFLPSWTSDSLQPCFIPSDTRIIRYLSILDKPMTQSIPSHCIPIYTSDTTLEYQTTYTPCLPHTHPTRLIFAMSRLVWLRQVRCLQVLNTVTKSLSQASPALLTLPTLLPSSASGAPTPPPPSSALTIPHHLPHLYPPNPAPPSCLASSWLPAVCPPLATPVLSILTPRLCALPRTPSHLHPRPTPPSPTLSNYPPP